MKTRILRSSPALAARPSSRSAFTLSEALIASSAFLMLVAGIVTANIFGLKMSQITQTKLSTSDASRQLVGRMADEVRGCKSAYVGWVSNGVFVAALDGEPQAGSALIIYPTTNTASYTVYFKNASDQTFRRTTSAGGNPTILAQQVTNTTVFTAQDCFGNVLTNSQNNRVIHFDLEFFAAQPQLPTPDYYKLETSVTKRALE